MAFAWWTIPLGAAIAALICAALIKALFPLLQRYALARPNARSSHKVPTPQGGGVAVVAATLIALALTHGFANLTLLTPVVVVLIGATVLMAALGFVDDVRPVPVVPRLLVQAALVGALVFILPERIDGLSALPLWAEKTLLTIAGLWLVNLTNFMDGLDWMMVAGVVPLAATLALLGLPGVMPQTPALLAAALCGALIGFAPFNRHVARLFLGDVGSLPIGLLTGYLLLKLAASGYLAAALLLPLYFVMDASVTLVRRLAAREPVWMAHRSHFYQRATDNGFSVPEITAHVFALNIALAILALLAVAIGHGAADIALLLAGVAATAFVLMRFARPHPRKAPADEPISPLH